MGPRADEAEAGRRRARPAPSSPRRRRLSSIDVYVATVVGCGLAAVAAGADQLARRPGLPALWQIALAVGVGGLADLTVLHFRFGANRYSFTWGEVCIIAGLVWVDRPWLQLVAPLSVAVVHLSMRRPTVKVLFNAASMAVVVFLARLVFDPVSGQGVRPHMTAVTWLTLAASAVVYCVWNNASVAAAVALSQGMSVARVALKTLPVSALISAGNTVAGLGIVAMAVLDPNVLIVIPFALAVSWALYRANLRTRQEADTWKLLQASSGEMIQLCRSEMADSVADSASELFAADFVELLMVDSEEEATSHRRWGPHRVEVLTGPARQLAPAFWPRVSSEGQIFTAEGSAVPAAQRAELDELGLRSCVAAPLTSAAGCAGMLRIGFAGSVRMTERELQVLTTFANQAASACLNAKLFEQTSDLLLQHRRLTDSLGEAVMATDSDGVVTFANPAAIGLVGLTESEVIGRHIHLVAHGTGRGHASSDCPLLTALHTGRGARVDDHHVRRGDHDVPVAFTASPLERGESVAGVVVALRDMSERRALEEQLTYQAFHDATTDTAN
ncbi:MAG TPA: PAS domain-containing protein, partial [Acidimicrobiales bacterium]|nr:PAS domain-containing protein [Acidimicrobiales bacterium]